MILQETSLVTFIVTDPKGNKISDAIINIDKVEKGITDTNGQLIISDLASSSDGFPHEYSITKQGFNESIGTFVLFTGIDIIERTIMTILSPGMGALVIRVLCEGTPCSGAYIGIEATIRGVTNTDGIVILENLKLQAEEGFLIFKPNYRFGMPVTPVLSEKTLIAPTVNLRLLGPEFAFFYLAAVDVNGSPISSAQVFLDEMALFPTDSVGTTIADSAISDSTSTIRIIKPEYDTFEGQMRLRLGLNGSVIMYPTGTTPKDEQGNINTGIAKFYSFDQDENALDLVNITVDDKYPGIVVNFGSKEESLHFTNLSPGIHKYVATKEGFENLEGEIEIIPNTIQDIRIAMIPKPVSKLVSKPTTLALQRFIGGSSPSVVTANGYTDTGESRVLVMLQNRGGTGYTRIYGLGDDSTTTDDSISCYPHTTNLYNLVQLQFPKKLRSVEISLFSCLQENQDCTVSPPTCTQETLAEPPIRVELQKKDDTQPDSPGPLVITPISGIINVQWNNKLNIPIFAFGITVLFEANTTDMLSNEIIGGYVPGNQNNVTISGLIPNRNYSIEIFALSRSNVKSASLTERVFLPISNLATVEFIVTSRSGSIIGPVPDATISIDNNVVGITDENGILLSTNILSAEEGLPHEYSVIKGGFNESVGTLIVYSGSNTTQSVIMGKITPGQGSLVVNVTCDGNPCEGVYIVIQRKIIGTTGRDGNVFIEGIIPTNEFLFAFKIGYEINISPVNILPGKTLIVPTLNMTFLGPQYGYVGFNLYDANSGSPLDSVRINIDGDALSPSTLGFTASDRILRQRPYKYMIIKDGYDIINGNFQLNGRGMLFVVPMYQTGNTPKDSDGNLSTGDVKFEPKDINGNPIDIVDIYVDGKFFLTDIIGANNNFINLSPGIHTYIAQNKEFQDIIGQIEIVSNMVQNIEITMIPKIQSMNDNLFQAYCLQENSTITFMVIGPDGPISDAKIFIDDIDKGSTDTTGQLIVSDISASSEGQVHRYLIIKNGLNNRIGNFNTFPGINIDLRILMTSYTPGKGTIIAHISCDSMPCEGAYIGIRGGVVGKTNRDGILIIENLDTILEDNLLAYKKEFYFGFSIIDIIPNTTIDAPLINLVPSSPDLGILVFYTYDISGTPINNAFIMMDGHQLESGATNNVSLYDRIPLGFTYTYTTSEEGHDTVIGSTYIDPALFGRNTVIIMYPIDQTPSTGSVRFIVKDKSGNIIDIVTIIIDDKYSAQILVNGEITYDNLPVGIHNYIISKEGFVTIQGQIEIVQNMTQIIDLVMDISPTMEKMQDIRHTDIQSLQSATSSLVLLGIGILGLYVLTRK